MTEHIARQILADLSYSLEEREDARLWLKQRRLFPGDGEWWRSGAWRESPAAVDHSEHLTGTIGELLAAKSA